MPISEGTRTKIKEQWLKYRMQNTAHVPCSAEWLNELTDHFIDNLAELSDDAAVDAYITSQEE